MSDPTPLDEGRRRTPITDGMANAMVRFGAARQCPGCSLGIPKYPGRYPRFCPRCGDELRTTVEQKARMKGESVEEGHGQDYNRAKRAQGPDACCSVCGLPVFRRQDGRVQVHKDGAGQPCSGAGKPPGKGDPPCGKAESVPVVMASRAQRIQKIIESGQKSFGNYLNDQDCSRAVSVSYAALKEHGGERGVMAFFEGPTPSGMYYRIEEREDPVIVAEFDNTNAKMRMFATRDPRRYLSFDPREDIVVEDHEGTFEAPLTEGVLQDVADKALGFLSARLAKLWKLSGTLRAVQAAWAEAQRSAGRIPVTPTLRIAQGLDKEMETALSALGESRERPAPPPLAEDVTVMTALGFGLAVIGGTPLLLGAVAKAAKWLGFPAVHRAFARAAHVAHAIEQNIIDFAIPDELSYALYKAVWRRGWKISTALGRGASKAEAGAPLPFENYIADTEFRQTIETGMWRLLLLGFFLNGAMHVLAAPLGLLFAGDAVATGVKGVELGQGIQRAMQFARTAGPNLARAALESVNPENVRMIDAGRAASIEPSVAATMSLFVHEADARAAADRLKLDLRPTARVVGESTLYALVHEGTGYVLARGEVGRLEEYFGSGPGSPTYNDIIRGPEAARARQRAIDANHDRVAGKFAEDKRSSVKRARKPGEGPTQVRGGFRIHVGANQQRKPNKDAEKALQNKMNAKRGLRARITGAKKWHRSREGKELHSALGRYNRESRDGSDLRAKILDVQDRIARYSAGQQRQPFLPRSVGMGESIVAEDLGTLRPRSQGGTDQMTARGPMNLDNPLPDDHLEAILRRLIATQNMDALQDVEFDEETGSIYLFFDPVLMPDEMEEVLVAIRQERGMIQLIASPDLSLPGESVESDWWVLFLPGPFETAIPDPSIYARNPEDHATKVQGVVMAPPAPPEAVAQGVDVGALLNAARS